MAVLAIGGAGLLIAAGAAMDQYVMRGDRIAWDAERASWSAERSDLYGRITKARSDGRQTCEAEKSEVRNYYRTLGSARDKQYQQLANLNGDLLTRLRVMSAHDSEQDRRIGVLLDQNAALVRSSDHRAAAADQIIQNTNVAVEKATQAADAAQQAVKATEKKK